MTHNLETPSACGMKKWGRTVKEPQRLDRILEVEEEERLLKPATERFRDFLIVWINTGIRVNAEGLSPQWTDVDLRRNLLTVQAAYAKSGRSRTLPLNSWARAALERLRVTGKGSFVFAKADGTPYQTIRRTFQTTCRRANIQELRVHDLRHTFASHLAMADVADWTLQVLGGWATPTMVQRYAHLSPNHIAEAVEQIEGENSTTLFTTSPNSTLVKVV